MYRTCNNCNQALPLWKMILSNWRRVKCSHCKEQNYTTTSTQRLHNYFLLPIGIIGGSITGVIANSFIDTLLYVSLFVCALLVICLPFYRLE